MQTICANHPKDLEIETEKETRPTTMPGLEAMTLSVAIQTPEQLSTTVLQQAD